MKSLLRLDYITALAATWFITVFIIIALSTLNYPFHLEWMEGQMIDVIARFARGLPLYTQPHLDYVPFIYTPFYFQLCGWLSFLFGVDFFVGRLVSLVSIMGVGVLIYHWIKRENGGKLIALCTVGLFFSTYKISGTWFAVARIDSLALFLALAALYSFIFWSGRLQAVASGLLFALAFMTKQSALLVALPLLAAWLMIDWRKSCITAATLAVTLFCYISVMNAQSQGWFSFFTFELPAAHPLVRHPLIAFYSLFHKAIIMSGLAACLLVVLWRRERTLWIIYSSLAASLIGSSFAMRLHSFSYINVLMPAHVGFVLLAGILWARHPQNKFLPILLLLQFGLLLYDPRPLGPSDEKLADGNAFLAQISGISGDIFIPELQFVQSRVGKKSYDYGMAAYDIYRANLGDKSYIKQQLKEEERRAIQNKVFAAIITSRLFPLREKRGIYFRVGHLRYAQELSGGHNFFNPVLHLPQE